jgi:3-oxosteroid 1-dehydrogenase
MDFAHETDFLVVGSGAGSLIAALVAQQSGLETLVVEKHDRFGGTSAYSGGGIWVPDNPIMRANGDTDSLDDALKFMEETIGDVGPASSIERRKAYLDKGPEMVDFTSRLGFKWIQNEDYPDYYPELPGASHDGRCLCGDVFDLNKLGEWKDKIAQRPGVPHIPAHSHEAASFVLMGRTFGGLKTAAKVIGARSIVGKLKGQTSVAAGLSLLGQLMLICLQQQVPVWLSSPFTELIMDGDTVVGAVVQHNGRDVRVRARRGVLFSAGGFARNQEMREKYLPKPTSTEWTSAVITDTGDTIRAGIAAGAATALMDSAWWIPSIMGFADIPSMIIWERTHPHSMIVDSKAQRYMNEAQPYGDAGAAMNKHQGEGGAESVPSWLVFDAKHRRRFPLGPLPPRFTPKSLARSGVLKRAETLEDLARICELDPLALTETVERFNRISAKGYDEDFRRGVSAWDRYWGDPRNKPNPSLGALDQPPYYAVKIYPGDVGTNGGLLTDENARVLREDGSVIDGLYCSGNNSATVMGYSYPGPGATLGPATIFAFIAAQHAVAQPEISTNGDGAGNRRGVAKIA